MAILVAASAVGQDVGSEKVETAQIARGDLLALFRDNSQSPEILSGVQSLFHVRHAHQFDAFDPDSRGAGAGLNFEHIISGHANPANRFTPRHGKYSLYRLGDGKSVVLVRDGQDSPWAVSSALQYTLNEPHYIDVDFRCRAHDRERFGARGYAIFFFADYMNDVADASIHFRGVNEPGGSETWVAADAPETHPDWNGGGTYRHLQAENLEYDQDHDSKLNVWSYDYPRFTKPFYYGRMANDMVFIIMFDRTYRVENEIRFSLFKFKLLRKVEQERKPRPAWDFQYVIHKVDDEREYGFKARVVWKKFVSAEDCLDEYERWAALLQKGQ